MLVSKQMLAPIQSRENQRFCLRFCQRANCLPLHSKSTFDEFNRGAMATTKFNVLSATATDLRDLLRAKQVSSVQLVKAYLGQIAEHDAALNAFICLAPEQKVIATAAMLDEERLEGRVRSKLHGIPVVLKVRSNCEPQSLF